MDKSSSMLQLGSSLCAVAAAVAAGEQKPAEEWKHSANKASASQSSWKRKQKDGKALCEGHGFTAHECSGISCCFFRGGVCWSGGGVPGGSWGAWFLCSWCVPVAISPLLVCPGHEWDLFRLLGVFAQFSFLFRHHF